LGNRLYGAARNGDVLQLDATTGVIQGRFQPSEGFGYHQSDSTLAISPDRRTLYVGDSYYLSGSTVGHGAISRYDITTATPVLLQRVEIPAPAQSVWDIQVTPDGNSIFAVPGRFGEYGSTSTHQTLCLSAQDLTVTRGVLVFHGVSSGSITITADGTRVLLPAGIYTGVTSMTGLVYIFDARSFELVKTVVLGTDTSFSGSGLVSIPGTAFDRTSRWLFAASDLSPPLRVYEIPPTPTPPVTPAKSLLNISTRLLTQSGDNALIGGFIVTGTISKRVILRGLGPSLQLPGRLADPVLELHGSSALITENDNWNSHRNEVIATGIPPLEEYEPAIVATLEPGAYTVILRGFADTAGVAVVEVYDLDPSDSSRLANISTRGKVEEGDNVMIGGWIVGGSQSTMMVVRAIGPSLSGVSGALADPTLAIYDGNGALLARNDDWRTDQEQALIDSGLAPADDRESAILLSMFPGNYTGIVRGENTTTGIALVEVYNLQ